MGDAEIAEAHGVGGRHRLMRPHAGMLARKDVHDHVRRQPHPLAAGHRQKLRVGNALRLHDANRLVGSDDDGARTPRDALGSVEMVEVRVADDDPVRPIDLVDGQADRRRARHAIDVRVEKDDALADHQAKGRAAEPVEDGVHPQMLPSCARSLRDANRMQCSSPTSSIPPAA